MQNQIREALKHKWFKGIEKGCDPGPEAINEWIDTYAETYRKDYDECSAALMAATLDRSLPRLQKLCPGVDKKTLAEMAEIVFKEFTRIWFLEMTKPNPSNHIEEI